MPHADGGGLVGGERCVCPCDGLWYANIRTMATGKLNRDEYGSVRGARGRA